MRFSSVPELLRVAAGTKLDVLAEISAGMRREWAAAFRATACAYADVALAVRGSAGVMDTAADDKI